MFLFYSGDAMQALSQIENVSRMSTNFGSFYYCENAVECSFSFSSDLLQQLFVGLLLGGPLSCLAPDPIARLQRVNAFQGYNLQAHVFLRLISSGLTLN